MNDLDQRLCARVPFQTPLHIVTPQGVLVAESADLSRTGVGIRITVPGLEGTTSPSLADAAQLVQKLLGRVFGVDLNPPVLGSLLRKRTVVVRMGDKIDPDGTLLLGCRFSEPLGDPEMVSLGVPLPPAQDDEEEWVPRADVPAPHFRQPTPTKAGSRPAESGAEAMEPKAEAKPTRSQPRAPTSATHDPFARTQLVSGGGAGWRATISGTAGDVPPLTGRVDRVTGDGVVLRVWCEDTHAEELLDAPDVVTAILAFTRLYGQEINVKLKDGASHVWTGPAVLTEMALPPKVGAALYLNLRYGRHLRVAELRSLGLERVESA